MLQSSADSGGGGGDDGSLSIGALVGIIIAGVIFLGALVIIIVSVSIYCNRKFRFVCIYHCNCVSMEFNRVMHLHV